MIEPGGVRVVFMGSADFAVPSLLGLIDAGYQIVMAVTREDKPSGRGQRLTMTPVKSAVLEHDIEVFQPKGLRSPDVQETIRAAKPDLIVVAAYGRILPAQILDLPRFGCVNVHGSLLPLMRGAAPIQRAVIEGHAKTGISIMKMDEGCDTGPVYSMVETPIRPDDTAGTLFDRLAALGPGALLNTLERILAGEAVAVPQDHAEATLAPMLSKDDGNIDWSRTSLEIANLVRGADPWPGAFTWTPAGLRIRVFPFLTPLDNPSKAAPGTVIDVNREGMSVATRDGAVRVVEVQPAGSRKMIPWEMAVGRRLTVGDVLGGLGLSEA